MTDLLPCPFCGSVAEIRSFDLSYFVTCTKCCGAMGHVDRIYDECTIFAAFDSKDEAAEAWNTRAPITSHPE